MKQRLILSALIGLVGAVNNNGKLETTDNVVRKALLSEDSTDIYNMIVDEKYRIAPDCLSCQTPCGNTSDYSLEKLDATPPDLMILKEEVLSALARLAEETEVGFPDKVYLGLSYLGYDLEAESYRDFLKGLKA